MSVRFVHAADFHLDSPFAGLDGEKAALRRREQRCLLQELAELTVREEAQLLLLAGDLLDGQQTYAETAETMMEAFASLTIPIFLAPGNHDWVSRLSPYTRLCLPENVHVFTRPELERVELPELGVCVWGAGYTDNTCPPLLRDFPGVPRQEGLINLLLLHGEVGRPQSHYCPITVTEVERSGMDYVALGHNHSCSGLRRAGTCYYAWPGCLEGRGFDECGPKGVLVGEVSPDSCQLRFVPMSGRRYETCTVTVEEDILAAVQQALPAETSRDIYRLILTGTCESPPDVEGLHAALADRFFALDIKDETRLRRDIWSRMGENTLYGYFLREMHRRLERETDPAAQELIHMAVRAGLAALEGREEPF